MPRKASVAVFQPRLVHRPETLRIGDRIRVTIPEQTDGITRIKEGVVGHRNYVGRDTFYTTAGDGFLFATGPALKTPQIVLIEPAKELDSVTLFDV